MRNDRSVLTGCLTAYLAAILFCALSGSSRAQGPAPDAPKESVVFEAGDEDRRSVFGFGETSELTIAYSDFKVGETVALRLFLADLETNRPIANAELTLTLTGPDTELVLTPMSTESPGIYRTEVSLPSKEAFSFMVEVTAGDTFDLFSIDGFRVPEPAEAADNSIDTIQPDRPKRFSLPLHIVAVLALLSVGYVLGSRRRVGKTAGKGASSE